MTTSGTSSCSSSTSILDRPTREFVMADDRVTLPLGRTTCVWAFDLSDSLTGLLAIFRPGFALTWKKKKMLTLRWDWRINRK
jgi:hypothetical protein